MKKRKRKKEKKMRMKSAAGKIVLLISVSWSRLSSIGHPWWLLVYGCSNSGRDSFLLPLLVCNTRKKQKKVRTEKEKKKTKREKKKTNKEYNKA